MTSLTPAEAIKRLRGELSLQKFGDLLSVSDAAVFKWESGGPIHPWNLGKLHALAVERGAPKSVVAAFATPKEKGEARP